MAGPGGGPSRRSHTKSRKGCKTCKRRHIRCDETFPQCRNCTKHQVRCDYMDSPTAAGGDDGSLSLQANLLWTPEIEKTVETWRQTGEFPFPELNIFPQPQWSAFTRIDLRLLHHIAQICCEVNRNRTSKITLWTELMPKFLSAAASHSFVMHSILSFSANHLAWISQSSETRSIAIQHRQIALRGLHEAIGAFSQANSDAVLAASLLLAWQATDWRNWASLMTGISSVVHTMQTWRDQSVFSEYLADHASDPPRIFTDATGFQLTPERRHEHLLILQNVSSSLARLQPFLAHCEQENKWIEQLKGYIERLKTSNAPQSPEEQFSQLYALRKWLFWVPVSLLSSRKGDIFMLLVLAHFYAVAIAIEPMFPDVGADFAANGALQPLQEIARIINQVQTSQGYNSNTQAAAMMMDFPREAINTYRARKEWARQQPQIQATLQHQSYGLDTLNLDLGSQLADHGYYQSLSPAFAPSPLHLGSPHLSSPGVISPSSAGPRSPYLEVPPHTPHSAIDTATHGYLGSNSVYSTPLSTPLASPGTAPPSFTTINTGQEEFAFGGSAMANSWHGGFVAPQTVWT
ncbi:hypothetical protein NA57DRAFT_62917 [Rhizodiscina lignyota]|uniref:Zn(2)-C6 fungal-type domain-containing protein n=1 Tax=Rhizodiscina lignyota TaxID=1504668 RepID=A0A9P4ITP4_9PEZI|nr:hypothetical protein NA57DRAFT_62917 [Rhizodiscina lignyota]